MSSLRLMVEKWLAPLPETPIRVERCGRCGSDRKRHVRVEVLARRGAASLHFFRHGDGAWHVFPPDDARLTMGAYGR